MKVIINPTNAEQMTGLAAFASWQNPDLEAAMIRAFAINPKKERLIQLEVTADGVKAILEHVPS